MKKITTLFKKDPNNLKLVTPEIDPENEWAIDLAVSVPTMKLDGTACAVIDGKLYKRYDVKNGKAVPEGAIPCQEPDAVTGHWPHWIPCDRDNPADKWHFEAVENQAFSFKDGTYELCGPKIQGNPDGLKAHVLLRHGSLVLSDVTDLSFEGIRAYLANPDNDMEGIVFHHKQDGRMCKIRKSDFGFKIQTRNG